MRTLSRLSGRIAQQSSPADAAVRTPDVDMAGRSEAARKRDYLPLALGIVGRRAADRDSFASVLDALLLLEERYGEGPMRAALFRPLAVFEAARRLASLTLIAREQGFATLGAFVGAEIEEAVNRGNAQQKTIFQRPKAASASDPQAGTLGRGERPDYRDFKDASHVALALDRIRLTWELGHLLHALRWQGEERAVASLVARARETTELGRPDEERRRLLRARIGRLLDLHEGSVPRGVARTLRRELHP